MITALLLAAHLAAAGAHAVERILVVGDSHTAGTFGRTLDGRLRENAGWKVATAGSCASATRHWVDRPFVTPCGHWERETSGVQRSLDGAPTPKVRELLKESPSDWVVIALGSNDAAASGDPARLEEDIARMIEAATLTGARCIWVGPPAMRHPAPARVQAFYDALARVTSRTGTQCRVIDSRRHTAYPPRGGDGTHYQGILKPAGLLWGRYVADEVRAIVSAPSSPVPVGLEAVHPEGEGARGAR